MKCLDCKETKDVRLFRVLTPAGLILRDVALCPKHQLELERDGYRLIDRTKKRRRT